MGEIIMWFIIILVGLYFFAPTQFEQIKDGFFNIMDDIFKKGTDKVKEEVKDGITEFEFNETEQGNDYGKILGHMDCVMDSDCVFFFDIQEMICNEEAHCIEVI